MLALDLVRFFGPSRNDDVLFHRLRHPLPKLRSAERAAHVERVAVRLRDDAVERGASTQPFVASFGAKTDKKRSIS